MLPDNIASLRVVDLKAELVKRKLPTKGKKDELVARLQQWIDEGNEKSLEGTEDQDKDLAAESAPAPEKTVPSVAEETQEKEASVVELVEAPTATIAAVVPSSPATSATEKEESVPVPANSSAEKEEATVTTTVQHESKHNAIVQEPPAPAPAPAPEPEKTQKPEETQKSVAAATPSPPKEPVKSPQGERGEKRKWEEEKLVKEEEREKRNKTESASAAVGGGEQQSQQEDDIKSTAVYIKGFVRPLIIRHVQELINQYGEVKRFWMDSIKTHCYVIYAEPAQAIAAHKGIHGIVFPKDTGRQLTVGGLTPEQAETLIEQEQTAADRRIRPDWEAMIASVCKGELSKGNDTTANVSEGRRPRLQGISQITQELQKAVTASSAVGSENAHATPATIEVEDRPMHEIAPTVSLDELFRKTATLPHLYYLPVSEQVAQQQLDKFQQHSSA